MTKKCENCIHEKVCGVLFPNNCPFYCEEPKHGEWIDYSDMGFVECPFCEHATTCDDNIEELHYCFFCGASMVKEGVEK